MTADYHPLSSLAWALDELPRLAADLPGTGGRLRDSNEDFVVEEIPAYRPCGTGEFLYLWIEKRGLAAEQLISLIARFLQIGHQDVGVAGLKDRHAVTRQFVSVPARCESKICVIDHPQLTLLSVDRHGNKLRPGHLRGNRFTIVIRDTVAGALERAQAVIGRLLRQGFPNYFGEQRFGRDNETLKLGLDLLGGKRGPGDIPRARRKFLLRLALSAVQSALFNRALADRLLRGTLFQVAPGDVMQVTESGGPFVVEDVAREQPRFEARQTVIAGPMFGPKMKPAAGGVREQEEQLLHLAGLVREDFTKYPQLTSGTRRAYLVWPEGLQATPVGQTAVQVAFTLPSGSYATVLLREIMQPGRPTAHSVGESSSADETPGDDQEAEGEEFESAE